MSIDRPICPVCHRPVQVEVVNFVNRAVTRQVFGCGAVYDVGTATWPNACPVVMAKYLAAEREIARLRTALADAEKAAVN